MKEIEMKEIDEKLKNKLWQIIYQARNDFNAPGLEANSKERTEAVRWISEMLKFIIS